ncbi:unnamed protein product [Acidithrix sp. C25]|nr:unnamed protein product [Acidithrix sp. C25]
MSYFEEEILFTMTVMGDSYLGVDFVLKPDYWHLENIF